MNDDNFSIYTMLLRMLEVMENVEFRCEFNFRSYADRLRCSCNTKRHFAVIEGYCVAFGPFLYISPLRAALRALPAPIAASLLVGERLP